MTLPDLIHQVEEHPDGFQVRNRLGHAVTVEIVPWAWELRGGVGPPICCGLAEWRLLAAHVLSRLARPEQLSLEDGRRDRRLTRVCRMIHEQRIRLLPAVPREVVAVQQAVFMTTGRSHFLAESERLYRHRWLVSDAIRYPAAAVALACVEDLWQERLERNGIVADPETISVDDLLGALADWRGLFSPTGRPYRSLDRTLMNLPAGPAGYIRTLSGFVLSRPATEPLERGALCARLGHHRSWYTATQNHAEIIHRADSEALRRAIARIAAHAGRPLHPRRFVDLAFAMGFLTDYGEPHRGKLGGLVTKAIDWHKDCARRACAPRDYMGYTPEQRAVRTALPPLPLPAVEGIRLLANLGDINDEGARMQHCVGYGGYADAAVAGHCFLFHIDFDGEEATIEMGRDGTIRQAAGPRNRANAATAWGTAQLRRWARSWPDRRNIEPSRGGECED